MVCPPLMLSYVSQLRYMQAACNMTAYAGSLWFLASVASTSAVVAGGVCDPTTGTPTVLISA